MFRHQLGTLFIVGGQWSIKWLHLRRTVQMCFVIGGHGTIKRGVWVPAFLKLLSLSIVFIKTKNCLHLRETLQMCLSTSLRQHVLL